MKKKILLLFITTILLTGCFGKKNEVSTENGPVVPVEYKTDEEKILDMIQSCIRDYNEQKIKEREEYYQISIPNLPINVSNLPEVKSLNDLTDVTDKLQTNAKYSGELKINDVYKAEFIIFTPTDKGFWLNGQISFNADVDKIEQNKSEFTGIKNQIDPLLSQETEVLNWLYGLDITLSSQEVENGYYEVDKIGNTDIHSIADLKAKAESIFTKEYLEATFYPTAFHQDNSVYKEINGKLCAVQSDLFQQQVTTKMETSYIIAYQEDNTTLTVDLLQSKYNTVLPESKQIHFVKTENGLRLPMSY